MRQGRGLHVHRRHPPFDLGHVEKVGKEAVIFNADFLHVGQVFSLFFAQGARHSVQQVFQVPVEFRHGGLELVGHHRQQVALHFLDLLALGDIPQDAGEERTLGRVP